MEGMLITDNSVWFGNREPEWWPEDEEEFEDRILHEKKTFRKALVIRRKK